MKSLTYFRKLNSKRGRLVYASVAGISAMAVASVFFFLGSIFTEFSFQKNLLYIFSASGSAVLAALLSWPHERVRSLWKMVFAGSSTVALSFLFLGFAIGLIEVSSMSAFDAIFAIPIATLLSGSLLTLGLPYIIGILLSLLFVNTETVKNSTNASTDS